MLSKVHFLLWLKLNEFCRWMICTYGENVKHLNGKVLAACSLYRNKQSLSFYVKVGDRYNVDILNQDVDLIHTVCSKRCWVDPRWVHHSLCVCVRTQQRVLSENMIRRQHELLSSTYTQVFSSTKTFLPVKSIP